MDEWPVEHKRKLFEIIRELRLPAQGDALDFGCGNGVLTEIVRQALPCWRIYGTDLSNKAVANARTRFPDCTFFESNSAEFSEKKFDFVFTNHVFEHVFNVREVFNLMDRYLKQESSMLHFLPCGNEGSYEHDICLLRTDGINSELENRYFFEDEGHVRRLTTAGFVKLCATKGYELHREFYSNQYYAAIEWITRSTTRFVLMFTDASKAINKEAKLRLQKERIFLLFITVLRAHAQLASSLMNRKNKRLEHYLLLLIALPFLVVSLPVDTYWKRKAREEWDARKFDRNGSEMCLFFRRGRDASGSELHG